MIQKLKEWWDSLWSDEIPYEPVDPKEIMALPSFHPVQSVQDFEKSIQEHLERSEPIKKPAKKKRTVKKSAPKKQTKRGKK